MDIVAEVQTLLAVRPYGGSSCGSKWRACVEANGASRPFAAHEKARKN